MDVKKGNSVIIFVILIILFSFILISAMVIFNTRGEGQELINDVYEISNNAIEKTLEEKIDEEIASMTVEEKIGQMFIIAYRKAEYTSELDRILKAVKPSGFILFKENVTSYENTANYINKVKETATIPMFIAIDQEGGRVQRIKKLEDANVLEIPDMYDVGKKNDLNLTEKLGKVVGEEIAAFGINLDFAPVMDIFSNPNNTVIGKRAFGSDSGTVTTHALSFAKGLKSAGVIPCFKHFPGHGDTSEDSHVELPVVNKTKEQLYENELVPFLNLKNEAGSMVMVAHIAYPNITGSYVPASLSGEMINGILREEIGYDGVVITDAAEMKALTDNYSLEEICKLSINAGVDIILMPSDIEGAVSIVKKLLQSGSITEDRIDESVKRILLLKHNSGIYEQRELIKENIGTKEHTQIVDSIK